jgi:predicted HTH transcriptional regulator
MRFLTCHFQYVQQHSRITNGLCQKYLNVNSDRASYLLRKMSRDGLLIPNGQRRGRFYLLATKQ